ncbi:hypothetical protein NARC_70007 [Candidatus Nitrosocosmicus arcticus]|uniref:Uncharacterized protein n=1 Tax=Candidatus Nitrosocosmicus arcticus TaxID=2035267 RepID=A0A557SUZ9_9ARCH|nr:hypothetical protein NARC_70007 [Candidatus Nitrosocosmicus arcticus]
MKSEDLLLPSSPLTVVIFTINVPLFVSEVNGVFSLPRLLAIADELTIVYIRDIKNKVQTNFIEDLYTTILKRLGLFNDFSISYSLIYEKIQPVTKCSSINS